jgi:hypothetical protein
LFGIVFLSNQISHLSSASKFSCSCTLSNNHCVNNEIFASSFQNTSVIRVEILQSINHLLFISSNRISFCSAVQGKLAESFKKLSIKLIFSQSSFTMSFSASIVHSIGIIELYLIFILSKIDSNISIFAFE